MNVAVFSSDPAFTTAATGLIGARGHQATVNPPVADGFDATICDAATVDLDSLPSTLDPLRTIVFTPKDPSRRLLDGGLAGFLHVFPRTSLAVQLPSAIALLTA